MQTEELALLTFGQNAYSLKSFHYCLSVKMSELNRIRIHSSIYSSVALDEVDQRKRFIIRRKMNESVWEAVGIDWKLLFYTATYQK
jgi:hypothetical protein